MASRDAQYQLVAEHPVWLRYIACPDYAREALAAEGATEADLAAIPSEMARMVGDTVFHRQLIDDYLEALHSPRTAEDEQLIANTTWRVAIRVFQYFPHPDMPKALASECDRYDYDQRSLYVNAGAIIASSTRALDLKLMPRIFEKVAGKIEKTYAQVALARLDLIERLRTIGRLPLNISTAGYWLLVEHELAKRRYENRNKSISKTDARDSRHDQIQAMNEAILDLKRMKVASDCQSQWLKIQILATNEAVEDPLFRKNFYKPWLAMEKRLNNLLLGKHCRSQDGARRGPSIGQRRAKPVEN
jgi:hypothetical protein